MPRSRPIIAAAALGLVSAACATAPAPQSGFLTSYEGLQARGDTVRASVRQRRDEALVRGLERVRIEPAVLTTGAAPQDLTEAERALVLNEIDRQVCYELSERFALAGPEDDQAGRVRVAATRISPTGRVASAASAVAGQFIPGPIGLRAPGTTGGLAAEAELLTPDGRQAAALMFARDANVVGTDNPSLSRVGDAHQFAETFGDMAADALAGEARPAGAVPDPDPCARYGPRVRPEGFVARAVTGLYDPGLSGGRAPEED
ncbi:DUF3313 family protein [Brevundimonas sp. 2R-24]|uniref:DUF3313 family protein n=1 Tax=Peiella sedimenti TaxID=3061083 RepID=A0ABT8SMC0_9CAUL|nr:DUF3313 family protein [Caulobacteraceae bacterium XZ-24]